MSFAQFITLLKLNSREKTKFALSKKIKTFEFGMHWNVEKTASINPNLVSKYNNPNFIICGMFMGSVLKLYLNKV